MPRKSTQASQAASADYDQFLKSVVPIRIGLTSISSRLDREAYARLMNERDRGTRTISTEYKLLEAETGYFDTGAKFSLTVTDRKDPVPALLIECTYEAHFHCKQCDKSLADRFTTHDLRLVIWPYFRELVSGLCGKMGIPLITVPFSTGGGD